MNHVWEYVWVSEDLEGYRCKVCGKEVLDLTEELKNEECKGLDWEYYVDEYGYG